MCLIKKVLNFDTTGFTFSHFSRVMQCKQRRERSRVKPEYFLDQTHSTPLLHYFKCSQFTRVLIPVYIYVTFYKDISYTM